MTSVSRSTGRRRDRRTRSARAEARDGREALLDAALGVFAERGYRDASIDEIAERAGYSKGAVYWHFSSKDELFSTLLEERLDKPWREGIALLQSASADADMAPEASARFTAMLRGQRELVLLDQEYWSLAVRDPKLRTRYAKRQRDLRRALGRAIAARMEHLGAPPLDEKPEELAAAFVALGQGLAIQRLIDARAVPDSILGDTFALIYAGHLARSRETAENRE
jgi:AcrR family transcriptional regulator